MCWARVISALSVLLFGLFGLLGLAFHTCFGLARLAPGLGSLSVEKVGVNRGRASEVRLVDEDAVERGRVELVRRVVHAHDDARGVDPGTIELVCASDGRYVRAQTRAQTQIRT